ncbi:hypothetical protein JN11_01422 [Mucilaginibacter frigoritolerans]|uniref:Uncharacterized protein n=1 Tax=Mucilaginibacter frigoritolerans TaxID=652788 RepID=A0A562UA23_9SPHI|nr:hypothetical protein [Mucilaginibacter frigoritolerans]TWJ02449.1 hypothetical protein JN11_01422 [Mucilaginibacter frigoritolerans]
MIDVNFVGLFTVELLHKFFADQLCPDFIITPSDATTSSMNGHKMVVKQYQNKLYAGIQSTNGKPFMPVENGMQMTFFLTLKNPLFFNYTNLSSTFNTSQIYYFTNRNTNAINGKNFLSLPVSAYNSAVTYAPGDIAADGTGVTYRAIRSSSSGSPQALTASGYWAQVDDNGYVNSMDLLQFMQPVSTYAFTTAQTSANISVLGYNSATGLYTQPAITKTINFPGPTPSFPLDLSTLNPGKYSLTVNGTQQWIYVNSNLTGNTPFAVVDIFNAITPASCNLVDGTNTLLSPLYSIYFLNRATLWKYVLPVGKTGTISDTTGIFNFTSLANDITSATPIPLSNALLNFQLTINGTPFTPIPCADPTRFTYLTQAGDTYDCSEIYINY